MSQSARMPFIPIIVFIATIHLGLRASAQNPGHADKGSATAPRDISALLEPILKEHDQPGMVAAVVEGWHTVAIGTVGVRQKGASARVEISDRFHLGSCTKSMTATLCAMLVEEGKLSWQTTISEVFPELKNGMHPEYRDVTLEQLLTHSGGVPNSLDAGGLWGRLWQYKGTPTESRALLLEGVVTRPPAAKPGAKYIYSNGGFAIAGHMAEKVSGRSWEQLMKERIFTPLGMVSAGFGAPGVAEALDEPRGHQASGQPVHPGVHADNPVAIGPAGTVHCAIDDWANYIAMHLRGAQGDVKLLKSATFQKLHQPPTGIQSNYAMGWIVTDRDWAQGRALTHAGSNTLWYAVTWIAPERNFAVLVASNQGGDSAAKACDQAASTLIQDHLSRQEPP